MFFKTEKSVIKEVEKEDAQLASILSAINQLYKMAEFKLSYFNNLIKNYNASRFYYNNEESKKFLESNKKISDQLGLLITYEKRIESDEKFRKQIFSKEIHNIDDAVRSLKQIRRLIEKESALSEYLGRLRDEYMLTEIRARFPKVYKSMFLMAKYIKKEAELLQIESSKISKVEGELKRLRDRINKNRRMPIVKSTYYHASPFIFNVGDVVKHSGPRQAHIDIENIFEEVRKREFPDKPSRFDCVYITTDPRSVEYLGIVYAVSYSGFRMHLTDEEIFTEAALYKEKTEELARSYWKGGGGGMPEILVPGMVKVIGLADYIKEGDKIETVVDNLEDDDGNPVLIGSKGVIKSYDKDNEELPFVAKMENGVEISLTPASFKVIRKNISNRI